ncbi:MFS transporter [Streptomyces sp. NPDC059255]|uniref:MFS transporter n=1 Tax=Streptomyces sp. NPDC059255 TaxID=3346793 RepID=UPI0036D14821
MREELPDAPASPGAAEQSKATRKAVWSGWIGSTLEYYDFAIYAQAAALVFPAVFFPGGNPTVALIAALATYAVGYVARPIGAVVLGHWGDRKGRKSVLVLAMILMGASTFAVGLLPTYGQVGVLAPALLVFLRLVQGFAVAGELGGASAMIIEHAPADRRGYFASFGLQGTQAGQVLAAAIFIPLAAVLPADAFEAWGWRIPFLLSAVVVFVGFFIRRRVDETPTYLEQQSTGDKPGRAPVVEVIRDNGGTIVRAILMTLANVAGVCVTVFGAAYATQESYGIGMPTSTYLWLPVLANLVAVALIPVFGKLSDRIGRRPLMIVGPLGAGLMSFGYLYAVSHRQIALTIVLAIVMFGIFYQMWNATFATFFQELFPTRTRVTGFALSQNVGLMIVAFLPTVFTFIAPPGTSNVPLIIGGLTLLISIVSVLATVFSRETLRSDLDGSGHSKDEIRQEEPSPISAGPA